MIFTMNSQDLLEGLNTVTRALAARSAKQILEGYGISFADIKKNLSADKKQNERTAPIVWECLSTISTDEYPLMWNIFPFHPSYVDSTHMLAKERKNRKPDIRECELGTEILKELIDCFDSVHHFYAVGRVPWYKLKILHPEQALSLWRDIYFQFRKCALITEYSCNYL